MIFLGRAQPCAYGHDYGIDSATAATVPTANSAVVMPRSLALALIPFARRAIRLKRFMPTSEADSPSSGHNARVICGRHADRWTTDCGGQRAVLAHQTGQDAAHASWLQPTCIARYGCGLRRRFQCPGLLHEHSATPTILIRTSGNASAPLDAQRPRDRPIGSPDRSTRRRDATLARRSTGQAE